MSKLLFLDTETSDNKNNHVIQLAFILYDTETGQSIAKNRFLEVNFIDSHNTLIHGQTVESVKKLAGGTRFSNIAKGLLEVINSSDIVIAHNAAFDKRILIDEFNRLAMANVFKTNWFCTQSNCKAASKEIKKLKLMEVFSALMPEIPDKQVINHVGNVTLDLFRENCPEHDARFDVTAVFLMTIKSHLSKICLDPKNFYFTPIERKERAKIKYHEKTDNFYGADK